MTKKPEDLDMTTLVDRTFKAMLDATMLPGTIDLLTAAQKEAMKRSMLRPIHFALPVILEMLAEDEAAAKAESDEEIIAGFTVPDSLDGLLS